MAKSKRGADDDLVRLYPVPGPNYVPGVKKDVIDVTPERAQELLAYQPPVYTTDEPPGAREPDPPPEPPAEPTEPTGPADEAGPSDASQEA